MPPVADAPTKFTPVLTEGKSIAEVVDQIAAALRGTELEPEWLDCANFPGDCNEALYGPKPDRPWPTLGARDRLAVSLNRGCSEGWIVYVDHIGYAGRGAETYFGSAKADDWQDVVSAARLEPRFRHLQNAGCHLTSKPASPRGLAQANRLRQVAFTRVIDASTPSGIAGPPTQLGQPSRWGRMSRPYPARPQI